MDQCNPKATQMGLLKCGGTKTKRKDTDVEEIRSEE